MSGAVASFLSSLHATKESAIVSDVNDDVNDDVEASGGNISSAPSRVPLKQTAKDRVNFNELSQTSFVNHEELFALVQTTIARELKVFAPKTKNS